MATNTLLVTANSTAVDTIKSELAKVAGAPYKLTIASTLNEALARLAAGGIEVVLLDLVMPDYQGVATFLRLYPKAGDVPVIALVEKADEKLGVKVVEKGAIDYLIIEEILANLLVRTLRYATERTHSLLALKASETKFRELYMNVNAGVFQSTPDGKILSANPAMIKLLGYDTEDELLGVDIARDLYMYPDDREKWSEEMARNGQVRNAELVLRCKDGRKMVVLESSRVVRDPGGKIMYYEGTVTDITEAHELSSQLSYDASHDALTGLINRREFETRLKRVLERSHIDSSEHAVCYLDLDQFKIVNDNCGHIAGDELLRQIGAILHEKIRAGDTVARLGGDEFGILLEHCNRENSLEVAHAMQQAIEKYQFVWGTNSFSIGASVGLVTITKTFRRLTEVLSAADAACYAAKDLGRNRVHIYKEDDSLLLRRAGEMQWVARVQSALNDDRFHLVAQPIVGLSDAHVGTQHYELLLRMRDEKGRVVPPGAFLPAVERFNLALRLDDWVVGHAFEVIARSLPQVGAEGRFFINLSGDSIGDKHFLPMLLRRLESSKVPPQRVCFEITETAAIANLVQANKLIAALRQIGCQFGLDDFGSGVSSFAYLKALAVDYLKIDGVFIKSLADDPVDFEMVRSINDIAHVMGKLTIAESVESEAVLAKLQAIGVDFAQGYVLGEPMPVEEIGQELDLLALAPSPA
ncbi:MAG TPA: EAL domain-containing protein [Gammaproteobacteria bacterium]|nr:EAL domain-containing protein [Gammaproteobacteria bacterium]